MTKRIFVKFVLEGVHCWSNAPAHRQYLAKPHRHLFHFRVETTVDHPDREIEFHDLLTLSRDIASNFIRYNEQIRENISWSCELFAGILARRLASEYSRGFTVEVSEDGECGAIVTVDHDETLEIEFHEWMTS